MVEQKSEHSFGGPWTEIKLDAVVYYLECYTRALRRTTLDLWYIDAFAGSGERSEQRLVGGIFDGTPLETRTEKLAGSARRALAVEPRFHHFVFIEQNEERCAALAALKVEFPDRDIHVLRGDANSEIIRLFNEGPWRLKDRGPRRGVVFLDPYSLQVDWSTLEALASTHVVDVWYLFPLRDVVRQLARDFRGIGPKKRMLDRVLGPKWRDLYEESSRVQPSAFGDLFPDQPEVRRTATQRQIETWFRSQLASIFPYASEPLPILTGPTRQAFSLFLAVANPSRRAKELAEHFASRVTGKRGFARATRRRSGP